MEAYIAALSIAVEDLINLAMGEATMTATPHTVAPTKSTNPPAANDGTTAVLVALSTNTERLDKLETQDGRRRERRNSGGGAGGGTGRGAGGSAKGAVGNAAANKKKPCCRCGKFHRVPDAQCWTLNANKHLRPNNYVAPLHGFGGGRK